MDGINTNTKESRKKFLVPLVVLLLCAVSLAGAAYAYSSTVTVTNNTVNGDEYVLEMNDKTGAVISAPISIDGLKVTSHKTVDGVADKVVVKAETNTKDKANIYAGTLVLKDSTVKNDDADRAITFNATFVDGKDGVVNCNETTPAGSIGSIGYTVTLEIYTTLTDGVYSGKLTSGTAISMHFDDNCTATLYYVVTVAATPASATGITFTGADAESDYKAQVDVDAVLTQLKTEKFVLSFEANEPA